MIFFDFSCGVRLHLSYLSLLGVFDDFNFGFIDFLNFIFITCFFVLDLFEFIVLNNRFLYLRFRGCSFVDVFDIFIIGISGVLLRSCGLL